MGIWGRRRLICSLATDLRLPRDVRRLTLAEVADAFAAMAVARTTAVRAGLVEGLLRRATPLEAKYLLKLMLGDMRIGVKQSLVEEAIAVAASVPVEVRFGNAVMLEADLARRCSGRLPGRCERRGCGCFIRWGSCWLRRWRRRRRRWSGSRGEAARKQVRDEAHASRRFWRTSMTGCGRRCIVAMRSSRGAWRSTRAIGRM